MASRSLHVLFAPDSFKGSLSSVEVARALAEGWQRGRPEDSVELAPLADGGEGTLEAIAAAGGWRWQRTEVHDPRGRRVAAAWLLAEDGTRAVVELATASGLSLLADGLAPLEARSTGTGELLCAALDAGVARIVLGIGGSATTDGGSGLLEALGARIGTGGDAGQELPGPVEGLASVDLAAIDPRLAGVELRIACDVTNPLLGEHGAAAVYGPQKGASPDDVVTLDRWLARWADVLEAAAGRRERETPGAGAAGGTGFGLLCVADRFAGFELVPGVELTMDETGFGERLAEADLVVAAEGSIDAQTAFGKTPFGVGRRAAAAGVPCIALGGGVRPEGAAALAEIGVVAIPVVEQPMSLAEAMAAGREPLVRAAQRVARLLSLGMALR